MSPIIVTKCSCSEDKIYLSIPKEIYFNGRIDGKNWELEYSKKVKEEKYQFYKKNIKKNSDQWIEIEKKEVFCKKCGKKLKF